MAIISPKIREVISELEAEGKAVSVTSIRERLGSGSYSTIGAVLAEWRKERAAVVPTVPAIPEGVTHLVRHLWAEAWKAADANHEPERQAFQRERAEHERLATEVASYVLPRLFWRQSAFFFRLALDQSGASPSNQPQRRIQLVHCISNPEANRG